MDKKENRELIIKYLSNPNVNIEWTTAKALAYHYADKGNEKEIEELLEHENEFVRGGAADVLAHYYTNKEELKKVEGLLKHENADIRWTTVDVLTKFVEKCKSVEKLDNCQKALESFFKEWERKQPQGSFVEKSRMKGRISHLLVSIGNRKAELSKKDGELLLGETVKKPKDKDKKIYRSLKRVGRNG
jgi:hypothetical protein